MVKILSISGIKTNNYTMWYRHSGSIKQKVIYVDEKRISHNDSIVYICPSCNTKSKTIMRTFNDRLGLYKGFDYMCKSCVDKNHNLSEATKKQNITKTLNKSRPRDIIERTGKLGFIGKDQTKNSEIRNKMNKTKSENNTFGYIGSDSHKIRLETYSNKTYKMLQEIYRKGYLTKIDNGSITLKEILCKYPKLPPKILSDYQDYKLQVWKITNKCNLSSLPNIELRGRADLIENAHHLDHRFSINEGFRLSVLPNVIGNINNLEIIHHSENCSKQDKCSILLEDLYAVCHL